MYFTRVGLFWSHRVCHGGCDWSTGTVDPTSGVSSGLDFVLFIGLVRLIKVRYLQLFFQ